MRVQQVRSLVRALNILFIVGAFLLVDETRLTQLTMGAGFLFMAQIEGGLLLWEAGARAATPLFRRWLLYGVDKGEAGLTTLLVMIIWVLLGINLVL